MGRDYHCILMCLDAAMNFSSIEYQIIPAKNLIVAKVFGVLNHQEMTSYLQSLGKEADLAPGMNSLYDLTACTNIEGDLDPLTTFASMLNDQQLVREHAKTALVVPQHNTKVYKLVQALILMTSRSKIEHRIFSEDNRSAAYDFIQLDKETIDSLSPLQTEDIQEKPQSYLQKLCQMLKLGGETK